MEGSSDRRSKQARGDSVPLQRDWDTLPDCALFRILQKNQGGNRVPERREAGRAGPRFLVCKRWWAVGRQAQEHFNAEASYGATGSRLVREIGQFPNLNSVDLSGSHASDFVLGALGCLRPKLLHLRLTAQSEEDAPDVLTPEGLSSALETLTSLKSLHLSGTYFPLPDSVSALQNLEDLHISRIPGPLPDSLRALPSLKNLTVLGLSPGAESARPSSIWQISSLDRLDLELIEGMNLQPSEETNLPSLRSLVLTDSDDTEMHVGALSDALTRLCNLEELVVKCPVLGSLPPNLHRLRKLRKLDMVCYGLDEFPACLGGGSGTEETLRLVDLTLYAFSPELPSRLLYLSTTLRRLNLVGLDGLPRQLGCLSRLESLQLAACNSVKHLPGSLFNLKALKHLDISMWDNLEDLPRLMGCCARLEVLEVVMCPALKSLPEDLGDMPALRKLRLYALPSLSHLPESLVNAKHLQRLSVSECPQASLPPGLLDLPRLDEESRHALIFCLCARESEQATAEFCAPCFE